MLVSNQEKLQVKFLITFALNVGFQSCLGISIELEEEVNGRLHSSVFLAFVIQFLSSLLEFLLYFGNFNF